MKVATLAEVAWLWCVDKGSVYNWINQGLVAATKSEGTWLVALDSVVDYRGRPVNLPK